MDPAFRSFWYRVLLACLSFLLYHSETNLGKAQGDSENLLDLQARFEAEYPSAVKKLEAVIEHIHGKAKVRHRTVRNPNDPWFDLEFFKSGDKLRFHRRPRFDGEVSSQGHFQEVAFLMTPEIFAIVRDPCTNFVWPEYVGNQPAKGMDLRVRARLWRFLKATFCDDGTSVLDHINNGSWMVKEVGLHLERKDWVTLKYTFSELTTSNGSRFNPSGFGTITFAPAEDWAIREHHMTSGSPYNFKCDTYVTELTSLPNCGYVAKKISSVVSDLEPHGGPEGWSENIEYELLGATREPTPSDEFTLSALGVHPNTRNRWLAFWVITLVLLGSGVLIHSRYFRSRLVKS